LLLRSGITDPNVQYEKDVISKCLKYNLRGP
jgi:hypothetical protein